MVLPVGGGGLAAGVQRYFARAARRGSSLRYVEPTGGPSCASALAVGHPISLSRVDSFVDGAAVARVGDLTFEALTDVPIGHVLIAPEDRICVTILDMLNVEGIVLEPAGALSVDALDRPGRGDPRQDGGLRDLRGQLRFRAPAGGEGARPAVSRGSRSTSCCGCPSAPARLRDFLEVLGPDDDIARFEYLKKSARNFGTVLIGIETRAPENFERLFARLDEKGFSYTDVTEDESVAEFIL